MTFWMLRTTEARHFRQPVLIYQSTKMTDLLLTPTQTNSSRYHERYMILWASELIGWNKIYCKQERAIWSRKMYHYRGKAKYTVWTLPVYWLKRASSSKILPYMVHAWVTKTFSVIIWLDFFPKKSRSYFLNKKWSLHILRKSYSHVITDIFLLHILSKK